MFFTLISLAYYCYCIHCEVNKGLQKYKYPYSFSMDLWCSLISFHKIKQNFQFGIFCRKSLLMRKKQRRILQKRQKSICNHSLPGNILIKPLCQYCCKDYHFWLRKGERFYVTLMYLFIYFILDQPLLHNQNYHTWKF